jgi:hypothetical protein
MEGDRLFLTLALIAAVISLVSVGIVYYSVTNLITKVSGFATSTGDTNLTVKTSAEVNFTTFILNWSDGQVDSSATFSILDSSAGTVTDGNWTAVSGGLILENIGNVNVTLDIAAGKTPANFIGGTNPYYMWNITNNEANSCINSTGDGTADVEDNMTFFGVYNHTTTTTTKVCPFFKYIAAADVIEIDFNLTIPSDSLTGALTDTITMTATAI